MLFSVFLEKKMVFVGSKPSFSRENDGFSAENHFILEKGMAFRTRVAQEPIKNHLFLESKMVFC